MTQSNASAAPARVRARPDAVLPSGGTLQTKTGQRISSNRRGSVRPPRRPDRASKDRDTIQADPDGNYLLGTLLEVCNYHGPYGGNFVPSLLAVGRAVERELGLEYHVVIPEHVADRPWVSTLAANGFEHSVIARDAGRLDVVRLLMRLGRERDARLVRSHFTRWDVEAAFAGRRTGARTLWHVHSAQESKSVQARFKNLVKVRTASRLCDRIIAVSEEAARISRARGFPAEKVIVVKNGIDLSRFGDSSPRRREARSSLGLPEAPAIVLAFGWAPHVKGVDLLLSAAGRASRSLELVLLVVGEQDLITYVEARLGRELPPWLRILSPVDDPRELYAAADVFVSASRSEGLPYAIGEAMAVGLPIISSDIAGPSIFFPAAGVRRFHSGDVQGLADALESVLGVDAQTRLAWGTENRRYVTEHVSLDSHVRETIDVFRDVLRDSRYSTGG